jgi:hypothetical protein
MGCCFHRRQVFLFLLVFALRLPSLVNALPRPPGDTGKYVLRIYGIVLNQRNDTTLNYARVLLLRNNDTIAFFSSDDNGEFVLKVPEQGRYLMICELEGFRPKKISIVAENMPPDKRLSLPISIGLYGEKEHIEMQWLQQVFATLVYDEASGKFTNAILASHMDYMESLPFTLLEMDDAGPPDCFVPDEPPIAFVLSQLRSEPGEILLPLVEIKQKRLDNHTVITLKITEFGEVTEYRKIIYDWGGVFYKRNGSDLSEGVFLLKIKALKTAGHLPQDAFSSHKK